MKEVVYKQYIGEEASIYFESLSYELESTKSLIVAVCSSNGENFDSEGLQFLRREHVEINMTRNLALREASKLLFEAAEAEGVDLGDKDTLRIEINFNTYEAQLYRGGGSCAC